MLPLLLAGCAAGPPDALEPPPPQVPLPPAPSVDTGRIDVAIRDLQMVDLPGHRFVVLGDGGDASANQHVVAAAVRDVCAVRRCDFALYLGDAIYPSGVTSPDDPQFREKFEIPYAELDFPFYVVTGNHDYGNGYDPLTAAHQVEYSSRSSKWRMPDLYYTVELRDLELFALDTTSLVWGDGAGQEAFFETAIASSSARWKLAFGHHPYRSNGAHGNAGAFDGRPPEALRANGAYLESAFERTFCEGVDVYFAGHDHDRQWLEPVCGVELVVSGAAARLRPVFGDNPTHFEISSLGFLYVVIDGDTLTGTFYDSSGQPDFQRTVVKP